MKKLTIIIFFILIMTPAAAKASFSFDYILSEKISEYGIFSDGSGILYAGETSFENRVSLFTVRAAESEIICEAYDNADGIQLTDSLSFRYGQNGGFRLGIVNKNGKDFIVFSSNGHDRLFTMQNDTFTETEPFEYGSVTYIAGCKNGAVTAYMPSENVQLFLNTLKEDTIAQYPFVNKVSTVSAEEAARIKTTLTACADVMSFDINNYDYDSFFKYVLYTHKNFRLLTDIDPMSGGSSSMGYNNVSIVSSDFIDYVMEKVFRVTPEKPPVNNLLSRGFCYGNGYYYYTGGFDAYFATEIGDLIGVYDIGGNVIFVIFSDIYYENSSKTQEYSFAVLQKTDGGYSLLRLGMGETLPSAEEVREYSPLSSYGSLSRATASPKNGVTAEKVILPFLLIVTAAAIIGLIYAVMAFINPRRK